MVQQHVSLQQQNYLRTQETDGKAAMFLECNGARKQSICWWCAVSSLARFFPLLVKHIDIGITAVKFSGIYSIPRPREVIDQQIDFCMVHRYPTHTHTHPYIKNMHYINQNTSNISPR